MDVPGNSLAEAGDRQGLRRATLNGFRLEMKLDPDDLPEGVELAA
jgi:hypothetical protein